MTDRDHVGGVPLPTVTDETMRARLGKARAYTAVLLRKTSAFVRPDVDPIIWQHGCRNMPLAKNCVLAAGSPAARTALPLGARLLSASSVRQLGTAVERPTGPADAAPRGARARRLDRRGPWRHPHRGTGRGS